MGLNSLIKALLPKDRIFFSLFEQVCENLESMAKDFSDYLTNKPSEIKELLKIMEEGEHKNDHLTHKIFVELGKNFITPFDREDIHSLAMALDDVADYMYASVKKITIYGLKTEEINEVIVEMSKLALEGTLALSTAVKELRNMKAMDNITNACVLINSIENRGDDLLDSALQDLFLVNTDAITTIKLKDIYQDMENITDKCEDAADVIESIIIKYS
ncbi:MAG TPA: DUF47 family protein [Chitinophagaceae bacterium]|nr:DUF47 family protein [Chitinophagaceae bacterium]